MPEVLFDLESEFREIQERCASETMTSLERMYALWQSVRYVVRAGIPGDIVECGVWRGGSMMLAALTLVAEEDYSRSLWLYDTFAGMPSPTEHDVQAMTGRSAMDVLAHEQRSESNRFWAIAHRQVIESNMHSTRYPQERIRFVEGRVEDTIPKIIPERIAVLRLDTDWYESTSHELLHLWPRLVSAGVMIVDDYGYWTGARRAVDEYFYALTDPPLLARIDYTGRLAVKR